MRKERAVHHGENLHPFDTADGVYDLPLMLFIAGVDGDIPDDLLSFRPDDVDRAQISACTADGRDDPGKHSYLVPYLYPDSYAVAWTRHLCHGKIISRAQKKQAAEKLIF